MAGISQTVRMTTSPPGGLDARIWVNLDYIVMSIGGRPPGVGIDRGRQTRMDR